MAVKSYIYENGCKELYVIYACNGCKAVKSYMYGCKELYIWL